MGGDNGNVPKCAIILHFCIFLCENMKIWARSAENFIIFPTFYTENRKNTQISQNFRRFAPTHGWIEKFSGGDPPPLNVHLVGGDFGFHGGGILGFSGLWGGGSPLISPH